MKSTLPGGFIAPWGMDFRSSGNLLVSDTEGDASKEGILDEFGSDDVFIAQLGAEALSGHFTRGLAVDRTNGHIYIADSGGTEIFALNEAGEELSQWTGANTPAKTFGEGCCFIYAAVDNSSSASKGDLYVLVESGHVYVFKAQGEDKEEGEYLRELTVPGGFAFGSEDGIAVDGSNGQVYVTDPGNKVVYRFSATGELEESAQLSGPSGGEAFLKPVAVAVDGQSGDVFVADRGAGIANGDAIYEFDSEGNLLNAIKETTPGKPLGQIHGLAVRQSGPHAGDLYVSEDAAVDVFTPAVLEAPAIEAEAVQQVSSDSADFGGEIDPLGSETEYRYEYGLCATPSTCASSPYEHKLPAPDALLGAKDFTAHTAIPVHVQGLVAQSTYHLRIVAHNALGETMGEERIFTTQGPASTLQLPDNRQWELVSPPDKHGASLTRPGELETGIIQAAEGGGAISYLANSPTEDLPEGNSGEVQVLSQRNAGGWSSRDIASAHKAATGNSAGTPPEYRFFAEDLSAGIIQSFGLFTPALSEEASEQSPYLRALGSCAANCYRPLISAKPGQANVPEGTKFGEELRCEENNGVIGTAETICGPQYLIASPEGSHVILRSGVPLTAGAPRNELYEWADGQLTLASILSPNEAGEELPAPANPGEQPVVSPSEEPVPGSRFGLSQGNARRAIASDGSRLVFESEAKLYLRDMKLGQSIQLDAAEAGCAEGECEGGGAHFQIASTDGSRIFFTDEHRLSKDSGAGLGSPDLYECRIVLGGEGRIACELHDLTPSEGGEGTNVQGGVLGASEDGSELYFVADGVLAGSGAQERGGCVNNEETGPQPPAAKCNLYELKGGQAKLVAVLSGGDATVWSRRPERQPARVSPNGQWLTFLSARSLTGYDNRDQLSAKPDAEAFLFDAAEGKLSCASCDPSGARPVGVRYGALENKESEILSGLRGEWETSGWVSTLLPHTTSIGTPSGKPAYQPRYLSDSGRLFFNSLDALVPQDVNSTGDVYEYEASGVGSCAGPSSCVSLISSGESPEASAFLDASSSGDDVFFLTAQRLLPSQDRDAREDVYDAHACSDAAPCFAQAPAEPPLCSTETSCKAAPSPPPAIFGTPASATFSGPGNLAPPPQQQPGPPSRAELLAKALKSCRKRYPHKRQRRGTCERQARAKYGAKKASGKKTSKKKASKSRGSGR